ncbi:MAG: MaoC family dehydratase [Candidatus Thermoplasmatota archaeon]|jgi:acyl dehydratase|nr:MaoC family dehydratase [Candidatus Thermoplasmatota archaeon]
MYFDDISVGDRFESGWRPVTQGDVEHFSELTGDRNPIHLDEEYARSTPFGRRIVPGLLSISLGLGLWAAAGHTRESLVALIGLEDVRFLRPVFPGDSLRLVTQVAEKRELKSRPGAGIAVYEDKVVNNSQEVVVEFRRTVLLKKRDILPPSRVKIDGGKAKI